MYICTQVCLCALSHVQLFVTPQPVACQAPLSMELSQQEYWSGLPLPPPGNLPDPFLALTGGFFTNEPSGKPIIFMCLVPF